MNYLIIPSNSIGGSEVRLVNNWAFMQEAKSYEQIKLVVTQNLLNALSKRPEIGGRLNLFQDSMVITSFPDDFYGIQKKLQLLVEVELIEPKAILILLQVPIFSRVKKQARLIHIHPGTSFFSHATLNGVIGQTLSILKADFIDVLDPQVYLLLKRIFFFKQKAFSKTRFGINQHSIELSSHVKYEIKANQLVFVGRFIALKQILEFLDSVLHTHEELIRSGINNHKFIVIGKGPLENEVDARIAILRGNNVPIEKFTSNNPYQVLFNSKIYFSLQRHNNYPSQSLIEAILCGCLPIFTNCGNSRDLIAPGSVYEVKERFSKEELADHCKNILSLSDAAFKIKSQAMINYLKEQFPTQNMAGYYNEFLTPSR